jgi:hypothetical protein
MNDQLTNFVLMRAKLKDEFPESIHEIASALRLTKQADYSKIILTSNIQTPRYWVANHGSR